MVYKFSAFSISIEAKVKFIGHPIKQLVTDIIIDNNTDKRIESINSVSKVRKQKTMQTNVAM